MKPVEGRNRVLIENIQPQVDCGRYPARRILGDAVVVTAAIFGDGHDRVAARLLYRHHTDRRWQSLSFTPLGNDLWSASFPADKLGAWRFTVQAWVDHFATWHADLIKRLSAQTPPARPDPSTEATAAPHTEPAGAPYTSQEIPLALLTGALLAEQAQHRAKGPDARQLNEIVLTLRSLAERHAPFYDNPITDEIALLVGRYPDLSLASKASQELTLRVDRERARFSTWYELFPRSAPPASPDPATLAAPDPNHHGTFADVEALLPGIAAMGFDVLYLPPIHPIGLAFRKGPNNSVTALPGDEGSPWAIGNRHLEDLEGGHKSVHPRLGTLADFDHLVAATRDHNMEIALDIAFQCSPDHPWVARHPTWFSIRPDGSIQYAENPPKKYQDIYPLNFESPDWRALWDELESVFRFWIERGVRVFRVDNPHTKALRFWQWCIGAISKDHPDVLFLAEAFTRPHVMYSLAKGGFTQSYTYFTWRIAKDEIQEYFEEITRPPVSDFFTPNLWPNTPDILHESLQTGGRPAFLQRLILAATLGASYGIYGPAYELCENLPAKPGSEEYLHSEKYQIRRWDRSASHSLAPILTRLNQARRENLALQSDHSLHFHDVDNRQILCYSKSTPDKSNIILVVVNLDPHNEQAGWVDLHLKELGIPHNQPFDVEDLLTGVHYQWHDRSNYVALRPDVLPAHIFRVTCPAPTPTVLDQTTMEAHKFT